ncbi:hypothetical protein PB2503_00932 [Parvularcula bermudensis HTCC2503]|uniref:EAL domain-containing protein n=1 Tax=Parvularcula bermudensis (strain ATCC BAA-594 / HTCC2503 / KCTC 12087) TaxID=314260 RepID=E0TB63_PARBH|nr:hypothetical protein PB2503_00932 [Parvularcula bermudensis HTCC2503]
MGAQAVRLTSIDIDNALTNAHLELAFQPIMALQSRAVSRYEAYVRWDHPGLGSLPPGAFLSFFESQGRIGDLTRYVLRHAVREAKKANITAPGGVSINLAFGDLVDERLPGDIAEILDRYEWAPERLTLECPQFSPEVSADEQAEAYGRFRELGCELALEVRGRASDAMKTWSPFPFQEIKTGGPGVLRQVRSRRGAPGLSTLSELLAFAKQRQVRIVAVGVEDLQAAHALTQLGFDLGQGNALGRAAALKPEAAAEGQDPATYLPKISPLDLSQEEEAHRRQAAGREAQIAAAKRAALRRLKTSPSLNRPSDPAHQAVTAARKLQVRLETTFEAADRAPAATGGASHAPKNAAATATKTETPIDAPPSATAPSAQPEKGGSSALPAAAPFGLFPPDPVCLTGPVDGRTLILTVPPAHSLPIDWAVDAAAHAVDGDSISPGPLLRAALAETAKGQVDVETVDLGREMRQTDLVNDLAEDTVDPADLLDALIAELPEVRDEDAGAADSRADLPPVEAPAFLARGRVQSRDHLVLRLLKRKYRITHFWPRSFKRALKAYKARKATDQTQDTLYRDWGQQNAVPVMTVGHDQARIIPMEAYQRGARGEGGTMAVEPRQDAPALKVGQESDRPLPQSG